MRTVFMGNPEFAIPTIESIQKSRHELLAIVSNPPKPIGRGRLLKSTPVGQYAKDNKIRLTCDIRFQPESEPKDPRYSGLNPGGTTGLGYGELNSARPLNEDWHSR